MSRLPGLLRPGGWRKDRLLGRVLRNSSYLFASNIIGAVLSIVTANLLGVTGFGMLGVMTSFVAGINRLFSFRMGDVVVRYMGEALARGESERAAVVVKAAMLVEAVTSMAAFAFLAAVAPAAAAYVVEDPAATPLFLLYGLSILTNITTETSTGVLQVTNHYRSQALINLVQSVLVAALIAAAYFSGGGLVSVVWAYLIGKVILGMGPILLAIFWLPRMLGHGWWRAPWSLLPPRRELVRFALSTNFSGTINLIARDSEVFWAGVFFNPTVAGYFKTALAIVTLIVMPINPLISTTYPEITRAFASRSWDNLRSLLRRVTMIAGAWTGAVALGLLLFGRHVLFQPWAIFGRTFQVYDSEFLPAFPVLMVLLVGFGVANILFWNRPLLLAQGLAEFPLKVSFWAMASKVLLMAALLPGAGYLTEAGLLSGYFVVSVGLIVLRGLREIHRAEGQPAAYNTSL
jgi:O-antigen/teichoic acid export membrane protein